MLSWCIRAPQKRNQVINATTETRKECGSAARRIICLVFIGKFTAAAMKLDLPKLTLRVGVGLVFDDGLGINPL